MSRLVCRQPGADPDWWFEGKGRPHHNLAKQACLHCPAYWACQQYALEEGIPEGIFGGMDGEDRARIWRGWANGRPIGFQQVIDANTRPLLQARRDHENFDDQAESWRTKNVRRAQARHASRGMVDLSEESA